jgi:hypothetical protein
MLLVLSVFMLNVVALRGRLDRDKNSSFIGPICKLRMKLCEYNPRNVTKCARSLQATSVLV